LNNTILGTYLLAALANSFLLTSGDFPPVDFRADCLPLLGGLALIIGGRSGGSGELITLARFLGFETRGGGSAWVLTLFIVDAELGILRKLLISQIPTIVETKRASLGMMVRLRP